MEGLRPPWREINFGYADKKILNTPKGHIGGYALAIWINGLTMETSEKFIEKLKRRKKMEDSWKVAQELIEKEMTKDEIMNFMVSEVLETDADDYVIAKIRQVRDKINNPLSKMNPYQRHYHKSRVEMIKKVARGEIFLSEARQLNLMKAFPNVNWNFKSAECINPGCLGDKPQFRVEGFLKYKPEDFICEESKGFEFVYTWASPGGGQSNLKVFQDGKKVFHRHPATFKNAENIWKAFENKCLK